MSKEKIIWIGVDAIKPVFCLFVFNFLIFSYFRKRRRGEYMSWGKEQSEWERISSRLCTEFGADVGLDLRTLRS